MGMKQIYKKPRTSGSTTKSVNGKFGIPSNKLVNTNLLIRYSTLKKAIKSCGMYMSKPKSSWSNPQNAPPQDVSGTKVWVH
jgi:hypothetical protein